MQNSCGRWVYTCSNFNVVIEHMANLHALPVAPLLQEHRPAIWQVDMIIDLLTLYNALGQHDRLAVDKIQTTDFRILNIPEPLRLQLKARLPRFRAFVNSNPWRSPDTALAAALDNFEIDVEKEKFSLIRGSAYVDFAVKGDVYTPWWVCEAGSEQNMSLPARRCSPGSRDQLRACDRVSVATCNFRSCQPSDCKLT